MFHVKQISNCPICNSDSFSKEISCNDHTYSKKSFDIVSCNSCSFWFSNPIPEEKNIGEYYKSDAYVSHTKNKSGVINSLYHFVKNYSIKKKHTLVKPFLSNNNTLLDYGCGAGDFLTYCKSQGVNTFGYETSDDARKVAEEKSQIKLKSTNEIHQETKQFDVITMWHVLEHVYDLNKDFEKLTSLLNDDGRLIVAVPNRESFDAKHYKESWAAYDLPRHLYHFTKKDITSFSKNYKLEVESILPMVFDSFYVSMLSEKYSGGNIVKGILNGLKSNIKGKEEQPNHSSLIYVLKKQNKDV